MADFYRHFDACNECTRHRLCANGDAIFERATNDTAARMAGVEIIDPDGHRAACPDCTAVRSCDVARRLDAAARNAVLETNKKSVPA